MGMISALLIWAGLAFAIITPLALAATSEYLAWRDPIYITAGFAGVVSLCLALVQPLLVGGWLPGLRLLRGRRVHRAVGVVLVAAIILHVVGLWITSPPDIEDALLLRAPTPFSVWGSQRCGRSSQPRCSRLSGAASRLRSGVSAIRASSASSCSAAWSMQC